MTDEHVPDGLGELADDDHAGDFAASLLPQPALGLLVGTAVDRAGSGVVVPRFVPLGTVRWSPSVPASAAPEGAAEASAEATAPEAAVPVAPAAALAAPNPIMMPSAEPVENPDGS